MESEQKPKEIKIEFTCEVKDLPQQSENKGATKELKK